MCVNLEKFWFHADVKPVLRLLTVEIQFFTGTTSGTQAVSVCFFGLCCMYSMYNVPGETRYTLPYWAISS